MANRIFVSYRHDDDPFAALLLVDHLNRDFPGEVFFDASSIPLASNYRDQMARAIDDCDILIAVVGRLWLTAADRNGRRLDNPADPVRFEIEEALKLGKFVMPVLIGKAVMPKDDELPEAIRNFHFRKGTQLSVERFADEVKELIVTLQTMLAAADEKRELSQAEQAMEWHSTAAEGAEGPCKAIMQDMIRVLLPEPGPGGRVTDQNMRLVHSSWRTPKWDAKFGLPMWQIHVMIVAGPTVISRIERVEYKLDPTYPDDSRESTDAVHNFEFYELANGHSVVIASVWIRGHSTPVRLSRFIGLSQTGPKLRPMFQLSVGAQN